VLEFKAPYEKLSVDVGDNTISTDETLAINITPQTVFTDNKKKPVDKMLLRPGVLVEIAGDKIGTTVTATTVKVKTNLQDWEVDLEGYFEKLEGDTALIDGRKIKLEKGAKIKGEGEWSKHSFSSFEDMQLGAVAKVEGIRKADGFIYANVVKTKKNDFSKNEKELRLKLSQNLASPFFEQENIASAKNLSGGVVKIGGKDFKLVESLEIQTYVNKVGFKLVPRYIKDLERNDPSKLLFRFYVVEDATPNAFAFADGSVFIHTGLLKMLKNEAQLASVLGHEIAHATHEHTRRSFDSLSSKIPDWADKSGVFSDTSLIKFGSGLFKNHFDREMENQADRVGLLYMYEAGYDPRESPKVWRELSKVSKENSVENFLYSSHPLTTARLKNLNREIAYNYYQTDFSEMMVRSDEYKETFGVYFGWIKKPERPQPTPTPTVAPTPTPSKPGTTTAPKTTKPARTVRPKGRRP
jgi:hypothetical protein